MKKLATMAGLLTLVAGPALADARDDALSAMLRCTGIAEIQARLACYDNAVLKARAALTLPAAPAPGPAPVYQGTPVPQHSFSAAAIPPPAPPPRPVRKSSGILGRIFGDGGPARPPQTSAQQFGSESIANHGDSAYPRHREGDSIDAISARLISYRFTANGRLVVSLDDGQEWLETSGENLVGHLSHPALYYSAQIGRGSSGSYEMQLTGLARTVYVRRLR